VAVLLVGAAVAEVGRHPGVLRVVPLGGAVVLLVAGWVAGHRRRWSLRLVEGVAAMAAVAAGAALGSAGWPAVAVAGTIPLAWASAAEDELTAGALLPLLAAAAGLAAAGASGRAPGGELLTTAALLALAGTALWAGRDVARREEAIRRERTELGRVRTEMVTTVSHELRTPLTVIQGVTATLARRWDVLTEPERLDLVDVLTENVSSLDASIVHFIDASRLERGELIMEPEWVDVEAAVAAAVTRRGAVLAGHEIRTDLGVRSIWADRTAVERMLEHLLMNAARFSAIGMAIGVRTVAGVDDVTISVSDHGQGIAPHLLATVWEPLQRGDVAETGVSRGAGLGLPIVRELARLHGGDASLRSSRGRGTTVWVTLPQPADRPAPAPVTVPATAQPQTLRVPLPRTPPPEPRPIVPDEAAAAVAAAVAAGPAVAPAEAAVIAPAGPAVIAPQPPGAGFDPDDGDDPPPPDAPRPLVPDAPSAVPPWHGALSRRSG
jgi:signal transduction histidine kinase